MNNELADVFLDCSLDNFPDVPEAFKKYCIDAVLTIKDPNTFYLFSAEEYNKFIEKIKSVKHGNQILRFFVAESVLIDSFEDLPEVLQNYANHFWNHSFTSFNLIYNDGQYTISKE